MPVIGCSKPSPSLIPAPGTALEPRENGHLSWGQLFLPSLSHPVTCGEVLSPSPSSLLLAVTGETSEQQMQLELGLFYKDWGLLGVGTWARTHPMAAAMFTECPA